GKDTFTNLAGGHAEPGCEQRQEWLQRTPRAHREKKKRMKTDKRLSAISGLLLLAGLAGCTGKDSVQAANRAPAAAPVKIATVVSRTMPVEVQAICNVETISAVTIKAQISGQLVGVHFKEGDFVKKGQLLFSIDKAPFEA